jgi:hypothetical protein
MSAWGDTKNKLKGIVDYIKKKPILDATAKAALSTIPIPFVGTFLQNLYEKVDGTEEAKSKVVVETITQLLQLSEMQFDKISKDLKENQDIIIENRIAISDLISRSTAEILEEVRKNKAD